jgi:hypothetical protein
MEEENFEERFCKILAVLSNKPPNKCKEDWKLYREGGINFVKLELDLTENYGTDYVDMTKKIIKYIGGGNDGK